MHKISLAVLIFLTACRVGCAPQDFTPFMGSVTHGFIITHTCGRSDPPTGIVWQSGRAYMTLKFKSRMRALRGLRDGLFNCGILSLTRNER